MQSILRNNAEFNSWYASKDARAQQVERELREETAKETLDPMASDFATPRSKPYAANRPAAPTSSWPETSAS